MPVAWLFLAYPHSLNMESIDSIKSGKPMPKLEQIEVLSETVSNVLKRLDEIEKKESNSSSE